MRLPCPPHRIAFSNCHKYFAPPPLCCKEFIRFKFYGETDFRHFKFYGETDFCRFKFYGIKIIY